MGCQCCRMLKSFYDPSEMVDVIKTDSAASSLYRPHHLPGSHQLGGLSEQKQGFNNLGYSQSNGSTLKLEVDNNHVNHRLHAAPPLAKEPNMQGSAPPADGGLYIIQPEALGPRWGIQDRGPSQVPVYPELREYVNQRGDGERDRSTARDEWVIGTEGLSADEIDEGVGGTPEYPCDTGDEGSVLSVEIHTSTTSMSSADTKDERRLPKNPDVSTVESGISVMKSEDEDEEEEEKCVTESMVAEALAALEAATAGEDSE
ncbi:uncharacterized protein LOC116385730 [Anarrhichthys ocellatus]|uniref:uncharacterized protein LOC116385730 n=1 Tax=Anarrhichthys ocellatus TaxID=433405 RepID=UPI0012ED73C9|nr:uncharacterized protein LOC116385730 [Anarrhichthys ocellatus]